MSNLTTTEDLVKYVEEAANELNDGSSSFRAQILVQLNRAYRTVYAGGKELNIKGKRPVAFPWARSSVPKVITLEAAISTGTVAVTNNDTAITFSSAPVSSVTGWHFSVDGTDTVYRISAHSAGSASATLDSVYVDDTAAASTYKLFKIEYTVSSDVLRVFSPLRVYGTQTGQDGEKRIDIIDKAVLDSTWPLANITTGSSGSLPTSAAIVHANGEGSFTFRFNRYVTDMARVEFDYIVIPTPLDITTPVNPSMPIAYRDILAEYALSMLLDNISDDRSGKHFQMATAGFEALVRAEMGVTTSGSKRAFQILPRMDKIESLDDDAPRTEDGFILGY